MKSALKKYISHWAFLPMSQFSYDDYLSQKRKYFTFISKMGMLTDATYPQKLDFDTDEIDALDTVNDFVKYLKSKGCTKINDPPEGHK